MKYGTLPVSIGNFEVAGSELLMHQYLPIGLKGSVELRLEERLRCFATMIGVSCCDFIGLRGLDAFVDSYIYLTAKRLFQVPGAAFNRPGYHSDGFLTDDINYIWSDGCPTVFNTSPYALTEHHEYSLTEMDMQSLRENEVTYPDGRLLRLDQFQIHKVGEVYKPGVRTFFKLSFSKDQYNLEGNSHNYLLNYDWDMKPREKTRNHPVKK